MNLKEFVAETLFQIIEGVKETQERVEKYGSKVNPRIATYPVNLDRQKLIVTENEEIIQTIDFDVALTAKEEAGKKGGIGIFVGSVGVGGQKQSNTENSSVSRVKFRVPITLPLSN